MKQETMNEHAKRMLIVGECVLKRCKTNEARKRVRKTNQYFKEIIKVGKKYSSLPQSNVKGGSNGSNN